VGENKKSGRGRSERGREREMGRKGERDEREKWGERRERGK